MNNWTEREDAVLKSGYEQSLPISEIAEVLGRTEGAVRGRASALGISRANQEKIKSVNFNEEALENIRFDEEEVCPYCNQVLLNGGECSCEKAQRARKIETQIFLANDKIKKTFGEECKDLGYAPVPEEILNILFEAVELTANYKIRSITIEAAGRVRAKLSRDVKGKIKIERSETQKLVSEVEE